MKASQIIFYVLPAIVLADDYPAGAAVRNVGFAGTGCSQAQGAYSFDPDGALTVVTPSFNASYGPDAPVIKQRQACNLLVEITYPAGWQFALSRAQVWGEVDLSSGATAQQGGRVFFSGVDPVTTFNTDFKGPDSRPYVLDYTQNDRNSALWSKCSSSGQADSTLTITTTANVGTSGGAGSITVGRSRFWTFWRRC